MAAPPSPFSFLVFLLLVKAASANENVASKYSYAGSMGPGSWGNLDPKYRACATGRTQSPVDIFKSQIVVNKSLNAIDREYQPVNSTLVNSGYVVEIQYMEPGGEITIDGKTYYLLQSHWHTPSEHRIDGVQYDAELHLVHKTSDHKNIAVIGILFQLGRPDPFIAKLEHALAELGKEKVKPGEESAVVNLGYVDLKQLRRNSRKYYRYVGSLTTPPCTEGITWTVLGKVRSISKEQIAALEAPLPPDCKKNSRPCQQLNGRQIQLYDEAV